MKQRHWIFLGVFVGCASSSVSTGSMEGSLSTIRAADEVGAAQVPQASLHLQLAKEATVLAKAQFAKDEREQAGFTLMRAQADAELALAMAREHNARGEQQQASERLKAAKNAE